MLTEREKKIAGAAFTAGVCGSDVAAMQQRLEQMDAERRFGGTSQHPVVWMVERDSCDPAEFFPTEELARKNACLGLVTAHVTPLYREASE